MFFDFKRKKKEKFDFAPLLESVKRNEIKLNTAAAPDAPDASKIGGKPFLPRDFKWPYFSSEDGEKPLAFLCQINLAEAKKYDTENLLPEKGMLSFFYEAETQPWGFDPKENSAFRVYFFESTEGFFALCPPEELLPELRPEERKISFERVPSYPDFSELEFHAEVPENADCEGYFEALESLGKDFDEDTHKLLGYADVIQDEMLTECESVSRGIYCGAPEPRTAEEEASIQEHAKDWILLLQLSWLEGEESELMWGDCGRIYFYIRKDDLKNKRFEGAWLVLQCC